MAWPRSSDWLRTSLLASDVPAILYYTRDFFFLADGDLAVITAVGVQLTDFDGKPITRKVQHATWDPMMAEKGRLSGSGERLQ